MSKATYNQECDLNAEDKKIVEKRADELFKIGAVESYLSLGKRDVCFKKNEKGFFDIFAMNDTLDRNERLVTRFNKRQK